MNNIFTSRSFRWMFFIASTLQISESIKAMNRADWGKTPLHNAAYKGYTARCRFLICNGAELDSRTSLDNTPLHLAAYKGNTEAAELLLSKGANPNSKNIFGNTPLHDAAMRGKIGVCRLLICNGTELDSKNIGGWTPLHLAAYKGHADAVELLRKAQDSFTRATRLRHTNKAEPLIDKGAQSSSKGIRN